MMSWADTYPAPYVGQACEKGFHRYCTVWRCACQCHQKENHGR